MAPESQSGSQHDDDAVLRVLQANHGFRSPQHWISIARRDGFVPVHVTPIDACPDCGSGEWKALGQFIHYSSLFTLRKCLGCHLRYVDGRVDAAVLDQHFDVAYKDEEYFAQRTAVFNQLGSLVAERLPRNGRVLDIGGATGDLLAEIQRRRPDASLLLNDVSLGACKIAERRFGIRSVCGPVSSLDASQPQFDCIIASDVLYYDHDIRGTWERISSLLGESGFLIVRGPNKNVMIEAALAMERASGRQSRSTRIRFFNPEHVLLFTRQYLTTRLSGLGYKVHFYPAHLLGERSVFSLRAAWYGVAHVVAWLTRGRIVLTPAHVLMAYRAPNGSAGNR